ncbi:MAG: AAA family ATPase [bacterium]
MTDTDMKARWMRELERLAGFKTQLYLYGNTKDTVLYPLGENQDSWTLGPLREALFEIFCHQLGGYDLISSYNIVDGMTFADARDKNEMTKLFDQILGQVEKDQKQTPGNAMFGRAAQPIKPADPLDQALQQIYQCLVNRQHPCVFIIEHASQLLMSPVNLQPNERINFLRLLKAAGESQMVAVNSGTERRAVQNILILLCDKLTDMPAWLYLNNPFVGGIEIDPPHGYERRHFFTRFLGAPVKDQEIDVNDLVDLTDGMTVRDLCGIRQLARKTNDTPQNAKSLVDTFKYGVRESEWDNLPWLRLEHAEEELTRRVLGQEPAVTAVADVLRRARLHLSGAQHSSRSKPRGVLFFAGPTGVGKTELAKAIAELVFRTDDACIRFDMSEYSQPNADQRLLGAPPGYIGYEEGGQLTNRLKANPFCVLLFDEIEKAHPTILDKFLQILEDGRMTDGRGETVYFAESIIIFTSNVGIYQLDPSTGRPMVNPIDGQPLLHVDPSVDKEYEDVQEKIIGGVQRYFKHVLGRPELLNRIGQNIVVFDFIRTPVMRQILEKKVLRSIQEQVQERWKMQVEFAPAVIDQLMAVAGSDISSGGRGMGNLAETAVLNPLARAMFTILSTGETLTGKSMRVTGVILPIATQAHQYDITWELVDKVVDDAAPA